MTSTSCSSTSVLLTAGVVVRRGGKRRRPLGLDLPDHLDRHHPPAPQASEFCPAMRRQRAPGTGTERGEVALP